MIFFNLRAVSLLCFGDGSFNLPQGWYSRPHIFFFRQSPTPGGICRPLKSCWALKQSDRWTLSKIRSRLCTAEAFFPWRNVLFSLILLAGGRRKKAGKRDHW